MLEEIYLENFFINTAIPPERQIHALFPLKAIGYLEAAVHKDLVYDDFFEIALRLSSTEPYAVDTLDGIRYEMPFPHVCLKKPGSHHNYKTTIPRKSFILQYKPNVAAQMEKAGLSFDPLMWQFSLTDKILNTIQRLMEISSLIHLPFMREKADSLAWSLLLELFAQRSAPIRDDEIFSKMQNISFYLMTHYLESPDIPTLARTYGFSVRSFFRHWKKYYTETPQEMIQRLKLEHAKNCLLYTNKSMGEIAEMLHCSSIYFNRFFRSRTGCTPLQYRKNNTYS